MVIGCRPVACPSFPLFVGFLVCRVGRGVGGGGLTRGKNNIRRFQYVFVAEEHKNQSNIRAKLTEKTGAMYQYGRHSIVVCYSTI